MLLLMLTDLKEKHAGIATGKAARFTNDASAYRPSPRLSLPSYVEIERRVAAHVGLVGHDGDGHERGPAPPRLEGDGAAAGVEIGRLEHVEVRRGYREGLGAAAASLRRADSSAADSSLLMVTWTLSSG